MIEEMGETEARRRNYIGPKKKKLERKQGDGSDSKVTPEVKETPPENLVKEVERELDSQAKGQAEKNS